MNTLLNTSHQEINILAFDTSMDVASVALWAQGKIENRVLPLGAGSQTQTAYLIPTIQELLTNAGLVFQDLNVIAVSTGPGSFTGIRLGLATAQGLLLSTKAKGFAPTTLQTFAFGAGNKWDDLGKLPNSFLVTLTTKRNSYYTQVFDQNFNPLSVAKIQTEEEIQRDLTAAPGMYRVEKAAASPAENLIGLYSYYQEKGKALPESINPFYVHDPEFVKYKPCSL